MRVWQGKALDNGELILNSRTLASAHGKAV